MTMSAPDLWIRTASAICRLLESPENLDRAGVHLPHCLWVVLTDMVSKCRLLRLVLSQGCTVSKSSGVPRETTLSNIFSLQAITSTKVACALVDTPCPVVVSSPPALGPVQIA